MLKVLDTAVPVACWSCSVAHNESTLFCPHCSKIQPPPGGDYFSVFGLEPRLNLDLAALEHEFHRLSRRLHPDRFARASENEKQWSLADTALLNDAYRTLKDPLRRTEYLLKLRGRGDWRIAAAASMPRQNARTERPSRVPADLLEEVFDLNMQLEEMRMAKKMGEEDPELKESLMQGQGKIRRPGGRSGPRSARAVGGLGCRRCCRAPARAARHGGAARPPPLPQQPGPRRDRNPGRLSSRDGGRSA